jgi:hypothetical protein
MRSKRLLGLAAQCHRYFVMAVFSAVAGCSSTTDLPDGQISLRESEDS